jgi:hypothetical protein
MRELRREMRVVVDIEGRAADPNLAFRGRMARLARLSWRS